MYICLIADRFNGDAYIEVKEIEYEIYKKSYKIGDSIRRLVKRDLIQLSKDREPEDDEVGPTSFDDLNTCVFVCDHMANILIVKI